MGVAVEHGWAKDETTEAQPSSLSVVTPSSSSYGAFEKIRADVDSHLKENKRLREEQDSLRKQYYDIQRALQQHKQEIRAFDGKTQEQTRKWEDQKQTLQNYYNEVDKINNDILLKESKNAYLRRQLIDLEEAEKLPKLQLADLLAQKRELEMEWQIQEHRFKENKRQAAQATENLKESLKINLEKEKKLIHSLREAETEEFSMPREVQRLKQDNEKLEQRLFALQKQLGEKQEVIAAYDRQKLALASDEDLQQQKEAEKESLLKRKEELEAEYDALDEQVNLSLTEQERKKKLIKEMTMIDQSNQALKNEITSLKKQLKELKPLR